jgi:hypothetical protein
MEESGMLVGGGLEDDDDDNEKEEGVGTHDRESLPPPPQGANTNLQAAGTKGPSLGVVRLKRSSTWSGR